MKSWIHVLFIILGILMIFLEHRGKMTRLLSKIFGLILIILGILLLVI